MKKHHPHKEIDVEIDEEERELFLNAVYQNVTISIEKDPAPLKPLKPAEHPLEESDKQLFLRAVEGLDYYSLVKTPSSSKTYAAKKKTPSTRIDASLDLHGLNSEEAIERLLRFIYREKDRGSRVLLVIHGKGAGVLKNAVWAIVERHPFVDDFQGAPPKYGGQGAIILRINRKYK